MGKRAGQVTVWALAVGSYQEIGAEDISIRMASWNYCVFRIHQHCASGGSLKVLKSGAMTKRGDGWHVYLDCYISMALINYLLIHNSNDFSHYLIPLLVPS